jgi:hydroxypyruvate reductase/glycerate 2-kinase
LKPDSPLRQQARAIWDAAVEAVDPFTLVRDALRDPEPELHQALQRAPQILVLGGGKAGAAMAAGVEEALAGRLDRVRGVVNVPDDMVRPLRAIRLHPARPAGTNEPTAAGVAGVNAMLELVAAAGPDDLALCLISGGGSALLPAPAEGITLQQKQEVTRQLHACGANIRQMNCVRKHLSRIKGGRLAQAYAGQNRTLFSLILSDVVGDPLDVIASGPTAPDPSCFRDAEVLLDYDFGLADRVPAAVLAHLERGGRRLIPETPKRLPPGVYNRVLGNNALALAAARRKAEGLGWRVLNLGSFIEGETRHVAAVHAGIVRSVLADGRPTRPPLCLLSGGETTVTLGQQHGRGGRNQEFVLACLLHLWHEDYQTLNRVVVLSGGTDGEDGPTDAAGAIGDSSTILGRVDPEGALARHDSYPYLDRAGALIRTGLTGTNVMDVRVILVS